MSNYDNEMKGVLFRAKERKHEKSPEYTGSITIEGTEWRLAAWVNTKKDGSGEKYFGIKASPKEERRSQPDFVCTRPSHDIDDDIPF